MQRPIKPLFDEIRLKPEDGVSGIVSAAYDVITGKEPDVNLTLNKHNFEFVDCLKEDIGDQVLNYYFEKIPQL